MLSLHPFIPVTDIDRHSSGLSPNGPDPDPQLRMWCLIPGQLSRIADPRLVGGSIYMPLEVQQAMDEMNHPVYARQPQPLFTGSGLSPNGPDPDPQPRMWYLIPGQLSRIADPRLVGGSIYMPLEVQQAMDEMNHPVYARQPHLYTDPSERF